MCAPCLTGDPAARATLLLTPHRACRKAWVGPGRGASGVVSARSSGGGGPPREPGIVQLLGWGPWNGKLVRQVTPAPERREAAPSLPLQPCTVAPVPHLRLVRSGFPGTQRVGMLDPNRTDPWQGWSQGPHASRMPTSYWWRQAGSERKAVMVTDPASGPTQCQMGQPADHSGTAQKTGGLAKPIPWPAGGAPAWAETPAGVDPVRASEGTRGAGPGMSARPPLDWAGVR